MGVGTAVGVDDAVGEGRPVAVADGMTNVGLRVGTIEGSSVGVRVGTAVFASVVAVLATTNG